MIRVIDAFKDFEKCFQGNLDASIEDKIILWKRCYREKYLELYKKCTDDYKSYGYDWREIARSKVFNNTKRDFSKMIEAYENIMSLLNEINQKVKEVFGIEIDINIVLYAGLCNSAGWVDYYDGKRAILFGMDKIAELKWHRVEKIEPLVAHELCHVIHFQIRGEDDLPYSIENTKYNRGIWRIYEEGFAQFYQNKFLKRKEDCRGYEWRDKCNLKIKELKESYLNALKDENIGVRNFYGDWFEVLGISDVGYFLGAELIEKLSKAYDISEIARLSFKEINEYVINFLKNDRI